MPSFRKISPCNLPAAGGGEFACGATSQMENLKKTYLFLVFRTFDPSNFTFTKTSKNRLCSSMKYLQVLREKFRASSFPDIRWGVWKTWFFAILVILALCRVYTFLVLHSGLAFERKHLEASYMNIFCQKSFSWKSIFFRESIREVRFFFLVLGAKISRIDTCSKLQLHTRILHVAKNFWGCSSTCKEGFVQKKFLM